MEFLKEGWYLGIEFKQGPLFFKIRRRDIKYIPVTVGDIAPGEEVMFEPTDDRGNRILEPQKKEFIEHTFIGIYPPEVELSMEYPPQDDRSGLPGLIFDTKPFITDGVRSPYTDPTFEVFTLKDSYPQLKLRNTGDVGVTAKLNLAVAFYSYKVVTDEDLIIKLIDGRVPCKIYTFLSPMDAPVWLSESYGGVMAVGKRYW